MLKTEKIRVAGEILFTGVESIFLNSDKARIKWANVIAFLLLVVTTIFSITAMQPTRSVPANAPGEQFSSARAMSELRGFVDRPRFVGSSEHARVREYLLRRLVELGLEAHIQTTTAIRSRGKSQIAGSIHNIVGRRKGAANTNSILLTAHYDTVEASPGAADDGAGIAVILEALRAAQSGRALGNDLTVLFSDGEEIGLLGASAFISEHEWARDIGLVLNLEARGTSGPMLMFETSNGNEWLIREYAKAVPDPLAASIMAEIYRKVGYNMTDFSIYNEAGLPGLNFSFIEGANNYHSSLDTPSALDERSIQHSGENVLALIRHFGNLDLSRSHHSKDSVYSNILGFIFVWYPGWLGQLLVLLSVISTVSIVILGFRRWGLTVKALALSILCFVMNLLIAVATAFVCLRLLQPALGSSDLRTGPEAGWLALGLIFAILWPLLFIDRWLLHKVGWSNASIGSLVGFTVITVFVSLAVPGASYLFQWPLLAALAGHISTSFMNRNHVRPASMPLHLVGCMTATSLYAPLCYLLLKYFGLSVHTIVALSLLTSLSLALAKPSFAFSGALKKVSAPIAVAVFGVLCLGGGLLTLRLNQTSSDYSSVLYSVNTDLQQAAWICHKWGLGPRAEQYIGKQPKQGSLPELLVGETSVVNWTPAPVVNVIPPVATLTSDSTVGERRHLQLHLSSPRSASLMIMRSQSPILELAVDGKSQHLTTDGNTREDATLTMYGFPDKGVVIAVTTEASKQFKFWLGDRSVGHPETLRALSGRSDYNPPIHGSDASIVGRAFTF